MDKDIIKTITELDVSDEMKAKLIEKVANDDKASGSIDLKKYKEIDTALEKAGEDDTPFLVVDGEEMSVIGDPNKTEKKKFEYTVLFRYPEWLEKHLPKDIKVVGEFNGMKKAEYTAKDVFLQPRRYRNVLINATKLAEYFSTFSDNGEMRDYTEEEIVNILLYMPDDVSLAVIDVVGSFLDLSETATKCLDIDNSLEVLSALIKDFPEVFNSAESLFT